MTLYTIYWMDQDKNPYVRQTDDLIDALEIMRQMRDNKYCSNIAMSSENSNMVGNFGVDAVKDGKTPDGVEYTWVKRRDGGQ